MKPTESAVPALSNDYSEASEALTGLFAVKLSDGGWSVADGIGSSMTRLECARADGWHLPVRFETEGATLVAIYNGPDASTFDTSADGAWARHCLSSGGVACEAYRRPERQ
ncbi:hypothetical protein [Paraburkholderia flagellata]|uniref:hypothetical protein n=1 Tax=Paraburkholderia flagellata TaxID=2883241 RepID=UPI001F40775B|nr:hypothetical protein [Paraburkholderia flagellata]